jgi:ATP synthase F1 delta subunit
MEELAQVYSTSLFEVASEAGKLEEVRQQLGQFADAVAANRDLQIFLFSPYFSTQEKQAGLERALQDVEEPVMNFLELLVEHHRMPVLFRIRQAFDSLCERADKRLSVEITSAVELDSSMVDEVAEQIGKHTGTSVDLHRHVDPEIIGGVILRVGNSILDASIRTRLERMRQQLARA